MALQKEKIIPEVYPKIDLFREATTTTTTNNNKASMTTMRYLSLHGICSLIISIGDKALFETTNTPNYTKLLMNSRMFMVLKHFHTSVEVPRRQNLRFQDLMWQSAMDKVFLELLVQRCTILQLFSN